LLFVSVVVAERGFGTTTGVSNAAGEMGGAHPAGRPLLLEGVLALLQVLEMGRGDGSLEPLEREEDRGKKNC
jgi:hypothetical protein